ncbi:MAG: hypothetical protein BWY41_00041 [Candidatus Atribacteria bacterium ADurb.Bin276]|uniref:Uncharacterized protein n=1 Tax=Candidatus Atribacter allofermentans TaxID=1852833 RepID=A0A1V5T4F1_9BACT|nr:MAG: hypothetical protein BWY41_00041 [Candidatus Atribacteria bacterium ADurb.Bin276]
MEERETFELINGFFRMGALQIQYKHLLLEVRSVIDHHKGKTVDELLNSERYKKTIEKQIELEKKRDSTFDEDFNLFKKLFYLQELEELWGEEAREAEYKFKQELMSYFMDIREDPLLEKAIKEFIELGEMPGIKSTQKAFDLLLSLYLEMKKEAWEMRKQEDVYKEYLYEELLKIIPMKNSKNESECK